MASPFHCKLLPMLADRLLKILRCPVTKQPLRYASELEKSAGLIPLDEMALITEDGKNLYRTLNGLPVLLSTTEVAAPG